MYLRCGKCGSLEYIEGCTTATIITSCIRCKVTKETKSPEIMIENLGKTFQEASEAFLKMHKALDEAKEFFENLDISD